MRKARLFIASSSESLAIAEAVNVNLDHEFETKKDRHSKKKFIESRFALPPKVEKTRTA